MESEGAEMGIIMNGCGKGPSDELRQAVGEFNAGDWFQCHETLEELWIGAPWPERSLYQGLLQLAVALHHWRTGNYRGAVLLFDGCTRLLGEVGPICRGIDTAALIVSATQLKEALEAFGPGEMGKPDPALIPQIGLVGEEEDGEAQTRD